MLKIVKKKVMVSSIQSVTEESYQELHLQVLVEDGEYNRAFAKIVIDTKTYKLAWGSDLILPVIKMLNHQYCAIGVDFIFLVIDRKTGEIVMKEKLVFFFFDIQIVCDFLYVITELQILKIEQKTFQILDQIDLPEVFEYWQVIDNEIKISCFGDQEVVI